MLVGDSVATATGELEVVTQPFSDGVGLLEAQFMHFIPLGAPALHGACNVKVEMRNRLMRFHAIVLPHPDPRSLLHLVDRSCCQCHQIHDGVRLFVFEFKDGWYVSRGNYQKVRDTPLFARNEGRRVLASMKDREGAGAAEVVAEGTGVCVG
jgi:hypothetical protein